MVVLFAGVVALFLHAVYVDSPRAFYVLLGLEIAFCVITGGYLLYRMIRHPAPLAEMIGAGGRRRRAGGVGGVGALARAGSTLAQGLIVLIAFLSLGVLLAAALRSLTPALPLEREARQKMADQLRARGYDIPDA
jgi:transposase